jgi:hypothetical protein
LTRKDFEDYGLTVGCGGCKAIARRSTDSVNHSEQCWNRIEKELMKSPEGATRVNNSLQRWQEALAEHIEKDDLKRKNEGAEEHNEAKHGRTNDGVNSTGKQDSSQIQTPQQLQIQTSQLDVTMKGCGGALGTTTSSSSSSALAPASTPTYSTKPRPSMRKTDP